MTQAPDSHTSKLVLLVEPDGGIRQSLLNWLWSVPSGLSAIGVPSVEAAIAMAQVESPSVILVDTTDPEMDAREAVRRIKSAAPRAHVVALTMHNHKAYRDDLASAGASASLLIWEIETEFLPIVEKLLAGEGA